MTLNIKKTEEKSKTNLTYYLFQLKKDKLLTADEEKMLSKKIMMGNKKARETLINSNLRLVVKIAKGYISQDLDLLDMIQEGNLGLIKAADKFDFKKNVRFSTYASFWIKQSIARALSNKGRMIRLPHRKEEKLRKVNKAQTKLAKDFGRNADISELSSETKLEQDEIKTILSLPDKILSIESSSADDKFSLKNTIEDPKYSPDHVVMRGYLKEKTMEMLTILNEKEKKVLLYRYSFLSGEKNTLKDIGDKLSISPETVRQIEMRALKKIREHFNHLKDFLIE
ncbi:MAG TPA: sigma-70 family RNA polymerase sigma factor [Spirochaetes bacterium]|nr:sigma-70 family RNA polymerase sigma factor [Spirochaetota bacterium]